MIGLDASEAVPISAKTGLNIDSYSKPSSSACPAQGRRDGALEGAMLVDSWYDAYLGVVVLVRVIDGTLKQGIAHHA